MKKRKITVYYDSYRVEMYFKKSTVTDDMFFRQLDGEQLSDRLLEVKLLSNNNYIFLNFSLKINHIVIVKICDIIR